MKTLGYKVSLAVCVIALFGLSDVGLAQSTGEVADKVISDAGEVNQAGKLVIDTGTTAWMLVSTALVLLMVPGLALFYGGLVRTKNVLGTMMHSFVAMGIIGLSWAVVGYAMCFGETTLGGLIGWNSDYLMLSGLDSGPRALYDIGGGLAIPSLVFAMFQGKFAIITPALIAGAFAERVRFRGYCLFILLWSLVIYAPLCHWIWGGGFLTGYAIDFAGGTVIHISAGVAGLVTALYFGARKGYPRTAMHPNSLVLTLLGAGLLWVGWFGFNAGSSVSSSLTTARALTVTQIAAATGAVVWILIESVHLRKATSLGLVSGILAGLVAITPAAGDVPPYGAVVLGALGALISYGAVVLKGKLGYDDTLDVFGIHGVAGLVGAIGLTFVLREVPEHGLMTQLWYQIEGALVSIVYAGIMTYLLIVLIDKTIGFRMNEREESAGMDHVLHGEHGYGLLNLN
ncbi:Ammonia channel precursor [Poriferisphaera corsica]|uniref:Ammonium transporter n=1 Tax=Poriferisphaera corsica TaxID=2528020 RepID=A0A517YT69_9BACT|nr:ammonium transporter [Poriferisphaera corsica]QDU33418.1 Ammonia channel precursor [Poriferisphaera corsica]